MQQLKEVMSRNVRVTAPAASLQEAAEQMRSLDVGALPVCDGEKLIGVITDRDIAVRAVATGRDPKSTRVSDVMSPNVRWCYEDASLDEVSNIMRTEQVRRVPVVDREKRLVGIVALADLAAYTGDRGLKAETLEGVSLPNQ